MNIDAYLYRVNACVASLRDLVGKVAAILNEKVYGSLDKISTGSLFDLELATSKSWVSLKHHLMIYLWLRMFHFSIQTSSLKLSCLQ